MMVIGIIVIGIVISGILYRAGGMSKNITTKPIWMPIFMRRSIVRDIGCSVTLLITLWLIIGFNINNWWIYLSTFILSWGALSIYWDNIFGYDNFYVHGLGCGLAALPLIFIIPWWMVIIRLIVCTLGMGMWSRYQKNDVKEEMGRGMLFIF